MAELFDEDIETREVLDWQGVHLLHFSGSACSQKTRIFLNLKGIDWVSHPVNLGTQQNYTPWFLGINPRGLVPVLVHDGAVHIVEDHLCQRERRRGRVAHRSDRSLVYILVYILFINDYYLFDLVDFVDLILLERRAAGRLS